MEKKKLLTSEEAAEFLGVSKQHLTRNLKERIGYYSPGGNATIYFSLDDLHNYLDSIYSPPKTKDDEK